MAEKSSLFQDDDDNMLLDEEKRGNKNGKYEQNSCQKHWKLIITGFGVIFLISLGVVIGAVFNNKVKRVKRAPEIRYNNLRLPGDVVPLKYSLHLHPNITNGKFGFSGIVKILINVLNDTSKVTLHCKKLKILTYHIYVGESALTKDDQQDPVETVNGTITLKHQKEFEFISFDLGKNKLNAGQKYVLYIKYEGTLSDGLEGFYKSSYKTKSGEKRYLATTHFEATSARTAFPCFDEPAMKAQFSISIVREKIHSALSNMPVKNTRPRGNGLVVDDFLESVRMSTYLVAFIVCDYAYKGGKTKNGVEVKVWAPKDQVDQTEFAVDTAIKVLDYYDDFFKVKFPLPKQDLIAIPDFAAGAMENWGLITYRLTSILYDKKESSDANKQWVAVVIAHELAHQWFGNLVTMKWWNDLWLNEGFAAYVEFIGANKTNPGWQMLDQFIVDDVQSSLTLDSHTNSHPISVPVHDPAQINEIFDTISYDKGASIIRMMKAFVGADAFHNGLADYLNKYKYSNAVSDDLWACLTKAQNKLNPSNKIDVKSVMDTWTLQMGYPVITIKKPKDEDKAIITQKHFLIDVDKNVAKSPFNYKWHIPITYYFQHKNEHKIKWFKKDDDSVDIMWNRQSGWIKVNIGQIGFYRVNYEDENWAALSKQLITDHSALSVADRSNLIDDAFELANAELVSQIKALDMTTYLIKEKEYVPWITALSSLAYIGELLQGRKGYPYYERYIKQQVHLRVVELGWNDTGTHLQKYLRGAVLRSAVAHNESSAVKEALKRFNHWMKTNESIPANLRSVIYLAGIKYGGEKQWNHMYKIYQTTPYPSEQRKIMFSLADTTDKGILKKYLGYTLDNSKIRSQDSCSVIEHISINPKGSKMAYEFVKKNWSTLYKRYGKGSFDMSRLIKSIFGRFKTAEKLEEAKKFLSTHDLGSGKLAAKQAIANIKNHIRWLKKNEVNVEKWLKAKLHS